LSTEYLNNRILEKTISTFQRSKREKVKYKLLIEDIKSAKTRINYRKNKVTKRELGKSLVIKEKEYLQTLDDYQESQLMLADAFYTLSENVARFSKFNYIDIDDAIQEGVLICFEKVDRFDPEYVGPNGKKAKAFNYMTTCILNHYRQLYRSARHYNDLKKRYLDFIQTQLYNVLIRHGNGRVNRSHHNNNYYDK